MIRDITTIDEYFPSREAVETIVNGWSFDWSAALVENDDELFNALEDGNITQREIDAMAAEKKEKFINAVLRGSKLTDKEAIPLLIEKGLYYYGWDHDGGKIPYYNAIRTYWEREQYIEHGINYCDDCPSEWPLCDLDLYVPGSEEKIKDFEQDWDFRTDLRFVLKEAFSRLEGDMAAAAMVYGNFMIMYIVNETECF